MSDAFSTKITSSIDKSKSGWRKVRFGDVVRSVKNDVDPGLSGLERYIAGEHMETDNLHIRNWGLIGDGYLGPAFRRKFIKGQVLYGSRRTYLRKIAVAEFDGICANTTFVLEPKTDELLPELLPFIMQTETFHEHSIRQSRGSVNPYVNFTDIDWYEFALPTKNEQRRIAEILWAADDVISQYQKCSSETMFLQKVFMESRLSVESSEEDWKMVTLADACFVQSGQVNPTVEPYLNMIHIAPDDIESQTGRILEKKTAAEDRVTSGKYEFKSGAILYNKIRPNLQKVALPDFDGVCSADVYPVYAKENVIQKLLFYLLLSEDFTKYAVANSVRSAIPKLNREAMMKYSFKLPPKNEQEKIVDALDSIATSLQEIESHKKQSQNLKNDLIGKLLFKSQ